MNRPEAPQHCHGGLPLLDDLLGFGVDHGKALAVEVRVGAEDQPAAVLTLQLAEDLAVLIVAKVDIVQPDLPARHLQLRRIGFIVNLGRLLQQVKHLPHIH